MKFALVSPQETYGLPAGHARVASVCDEQFEVAPPLFWAECADDIAADAFSYSVVAAAFEPIAPEQPPGQSEQPASSGMESL